MVGLIAVGAPEVRDAIVNDETDAVLSNPGEYQLSEEGEVATRSVFPSAEVIDVNGATVDSAEFIGAPMVVNLWFAACPPCSVRCRTSQQFMSVLATRSGLWELIPSTPHQR